MPAELQLVLCIQYLVLDPAELTMAAFIGSDSRLGEEALAEEEIMMVGLAKLNAQDLTSKKFLFREAGY